jgi:plastocyanin
LAGLVAICLVSGCAGRTDAPTSPGGDGATTEVVTAGLTFIPSDVTIAVGGTVNFNITGGVAHDVTFQAVTGAPASIPVTADHVVPRTFNTKGVFPYDCRTHPGMSGVVRVQ